MKSDKTAHRENQERLSGLKSHYDMIVIGGGIQGATMALEAASRGTSVLLLEKNDFGSGASANSLKIIHGGIRYLQGFDFSRMRQSIRERRALLRIAPHLVQPMRCIIPAYDGFKGKAALWLGTKMYDCIAVDRNRSLDPARQIAGSGVLSSIKLRHLCPVPKSNGVAGGAWWWDAQVHNSERLVFAFVMSAKQIGADVRNYMSALEIVVERGRVRGVVAQDVVTGDKREVLGDVVMDCSGSWFCGSVAGTGRRCAMAMNLVVRRRLADCAFGIRSAHNTKRSCFYAPWRDGGMIGTWYTHANNAGNPDALTISQKIVKDALADINKGIEAPDLRLEEVTAVHLGLLPAISGSNGSEEPALSDRFSIVDGAKEGRAGLFQVQGVKYTTARDVSANAFSAASRYLQATPGPRSSDLRPIYGGDIIGIESFRKACLSRYSSDFSPEVVTRLLENYGSQIHRILDGARSSSRPGLVVPGTKNVLQAELTFVLDNEMVCTLSDLIYRRTDLGTFSKPSLETIEFCADFMSERLGWDHETRFANICDLYRQLPRWFEPERYVSQVNRCEHNNCITE